VHISLRIEAAYVPGEQSVHEVLPEVLKVPLAQVLQWLLPSISLILPAAHGSHSLLPASLLVPAKQFAQEVALLEELILPAAQLSQVETPPSEKVPMSQSTQDLEPDEDILLVPGPHASQLFNPLSLLNVPGAQGVQERYPPREKEPCKQSSHSGEPDEEEYFPSAQLAQPVARPSSSSALFPAAQAVQVEDSMSEYSPDGQATHEVCRPSTSTELFFPAAQLAQACAPSTAACVPLPHSLQ
jgi:hypothetical protein